MNLLSAAQVEHLARQPIPGTNRAGDNARLEPTFEAVAQEIAKLDSLTAEDPVRWRDVLEQSQQILAQQSKDFLVACYLTRALSEFHGVDGLQQGLALARDLAHTFWDDAFPPVKRLRGRAQAFEWLVEKCTPLLERYQPDAAQFETVKNLEATVIALDDFLVEKMAAAAPNLADLRQRCRRLRQGMEQQGMEQQRLEPQGSGQQRGQQPHPQNPAAQTASRDAAAPAGASRTEPAAPAVSVSTPGSITQEKDVIAVYRACQDPLRAVSQYLRAKNLSDPESYRLNRFVTWLGISQLPPASNGKTQLKPVPKEKIASLQTMQREQRWHDLIPELETSISRAPYWLDGHRLACEALAAINAEEARQAVIDCVRSFVARIPEVVNCQFADGTPFADEQTKQWLNRDVNARHQASASTGIVIDASGVSPHWQVAGEQAAALAQQKKLREALALFQDGCNQSTSLREQALWRFNQAHFCFEHGLPALALPLLENLDRQLQEKGVADWEPQLTRKILELLLRCYHASARPEAGQTATAQSRIQDVHARLCQLDLALAFDLTANL